MTLVNNGNFYFYSCQASRLALLLSGHDGVYV